MKKTLLILTLLSNICIFSNKINEIINSDKYYWGKGDGFTLVEAQNNALQMLANSISCTVTSEGSINVTDTNGKFDKKVSSIIKTYSNAKLMKFEQIVESQEPEAKIFVYIKRTDIEKIFLQRKDKIFAFVKNAENALSQYKISDALRYYYWALVMLKKHPNCEAIKLDTKDGNKLLITYLPYTINNIFQDITINVVKIEKIKDEKNIELNIRYKNKNVTNIDYSYYTGNSFTNITTAKDGVGIMVLYGQSMKMNQNTLKFEYEYKGESKIDKELQVAITKEITRFKSAYFTIKLNVNNKKTQYNNKQALLHPIKNSEKYSEILNKILTNIDTISKEYFTENGYKSFRKLIQYGNAKIINKSSLKFYSYDNEIVARSVLMKFNFKSNSKQFVEKVNFIFNKNGKIEAISFGLSNIAFNNIANKQKWPLKDKLLLITFLETYKTAYALKRIDYINSIFDNDALIITGRVVKTKKRKDDRYNNNKIITYHQQTKKEYIKNLRKLFKSKEYINLKFEESTIKKSGLKGDIYGIGIKQNYFSNNYGDVGYLFLIVDITNKKVPIIHVRTWQPGSDISENDKYSLGFF